jgi:excisionase family DNA binding protein
MNEYLEVTDIMRILRVSKTTAYGYIRTGKLRVYRVGRLVRIKHADLEQFVEGKPVLRPDWMGNNGKTKE